MYTNIQIFIATVILAGVAMATAAHEPGQRAVQMDPFLLSMHNGIEAELANLMAHSAQNQQLLSSATDTENLAFQQAIKRVLDINISQLKVNLARIHSLPKRLGSKYILVNIAKFELLLIDNGQEVFHSRAIVGLPERQTPVLSAQMSHLVLNPNWDVPHSIAVRDLLPKIKADPGYLRRNGYLLLQGWLHEETIVDPDSIEWAKIDEHNFVYHLRQRPSNSNALGKIKFVFPNDQYIFIHDTPQKELFGNAARAHSSGCVRISLPLELADRLLAESDDWSRDDLKAKIDSGDTISIPLVNPVPVHLVYLTVWMEQGKLTFLDDVYQRDPLELEPSGCDK